MSELEIINERNLSDIRTQLVTKHGFKLASGDLQGLEFVYSSWFRYGPNIQYELTTGNGRGAGNIAQAAVEAVEAVFQLTPH